MAPELTRACPHLCLHAGCARIEDRRTVGPHRGLSDLRQLLAGLNVFEDGLLQARQVLVAVLQHGLQAVRHAHARHGASGAAAGAADQAPRPAIPLIRVRARCRDQGRARAARSGVAGSSASESVHAARRGDVGAGGVGQEKAGKAL